MTIRARVLCSLGVSGLFAAILVWTLAAHVPDLVESPLVDAPPEWPVVPIALDEPPAGQPPVYVIELHIDDPIRLPTFPEIRMAFGTFDSEPELTSATLSLLGTACTYRTRPGGQIVNGRELAFVRDPSCATLRAAPTGVVDLTVRLARSARLAVFVYRAPAATTLLHALQLRPVAAYPGSALLLVGDYLVPAADTGTRRIDLLNYMWDWNPSAHWIWIAFATSALLLFAGCLLVPSPHLAWRSMGAASCAAAIALAWSVLMPPLQAADEPDHLLSFGQLLNIPVKPGLEALALKMHFNRIVFQPDQHFRPVNRTRPFSTPWFGEVHAEDTARRSPLTVIFWRAVAPLVDLSHQHPFVSLWRLRLLHGAVFVLAVGLSSVLLQVVGGARTLWPLMGLALLPTLPYFATMVSEWALVASIGVCWSSGVLLLWEDGPRSSATGWLIGCGFALLAATTLGALPAVPLVGMLLAGRILLGTRGRRGQLRELLVFWVGLGAGLGIGYLLLGRLYLEGYWRGDAAGGEGKVFLTSVNRALAIVSTYPVLILLMIAGAGAALEWLFGKLQWPAAARRFAARALTAVTLVAGAIAVLVFLASIVTTLPRLATIERYNTPADYAWNALLAGATTFRWKVFEPLFLTFWGGFGWLDIALPQVLIGTVSAAIVGAFAVLMRQLTGRQDVRRLGWLAIVLLGAAVSLATYAAASYLLRRNLHGRYLLALYLPLLVIISQGAAPAFDWMRLRMNPLLLAVITAVALVTVHATCMVFVLERYF